jgi:adenine-specific DNA methylase
MLMALLLPDPCDAHCPGSFKEEARRLLKPMPMVGATATDEQLRKALLKFIADFANWDRSADAAYLECAMGLVRAAHGEEPPLVVDPFAGGGSIPLEALRIGCDAFASDLNPVACLILKVLLEDIPRYGPGLADELRRVGKEIKDAAGKELAEFYRPDPDGARPIAYLWARTVRCEAPKCGAEIPLMKSFWLCNKASRKRALRPRVIRPKESVPQIEFEIFEPKTDRDVPTGTVARAKATCLACGTVLSPDRVRAQLAGQRGGADVLFDERGHRIGGARLVAVVTLRDEQKGRYYRVSTERDYEAARWAAERFIKVASKLLLDGLCAIPDEATPVGGGSGAGRAFSIQKYGILQWGDLFTARQKLLLTTVLPLTRPVNPKASQILSLAVNKLADKASSFCRWKPSAEYMAGNTFSRPALSVLWDFCEAHPFAGVSGGWEEEIEWVAQVVDSYPDSNGTSAQVQQADARALPLPDDSAPVWFTDPPYYDAIPYADLSDFFYALLRRTLPGNQTLRNPFEAGSNLTPKCPEIVQDEIKTTAEGLPKDKTFFESAMGRAFGDSRRILKPEGIGCVVFAHKTTEGWEALIGGLLGGRWTVTASWPVATEMAVRLRARESAALSASVHLVCRPRPENAGVGGWEDILRELPKRISEWMERLSSEGIRGADLVFSCIGPALELFSRYDEVETAEGREVKLDEFLEKVWEVVGRTALQQVLGTAEARARNSAAGALEEDARLTGLFLWTLQSTDKGLTTEDAEGEQEEEDEEEAGKPKKGYTLIYDVVRRFAQPLGIHLENWEGRVIEIRKGIVRLIPVLEREEQIFGTSGTHAVARALERTGGRDSQYMLFPEQPEGRRSRGRKPRRSRRQEEAEASAPRREATTLDRVHAAMILQARGEATALRAMLQAEIERSPDFLRLANALSALYPKDSEEKRLLDAMLLAVPR